MRTVTYCFDQAELEAIIEVTSRDEVYKALGYLTTWAVGSTMYQDVQIHLFISGVQAIYRDGNGTARYSINAVRHDDHFGFQS